MHEFIRLLCLRCGQGNFEDLEQHEVKCKKFLYHHALAQMVQMGFHDCDAIREMLDLCAGQLETTIRLLERA